MEHIAARGRQYEVGPSFERSIRALIRVDLGRLLHPVLNLPCGMRPEELTAAAHEQLRARRPRG